MSRITKEEIEKTKCGRFLLSDENIYLSIYSLNSYVFEYNLLNTEDRILYHRLQDKFDARFINGVITRVREQIIELFDKDKYIEAKVYFKPKKLSENGELEFRPLHSTGLITQIAIVSMLHLFVYEIPEEEEGDPKLRLSNLSRLIPSDFYGNRVSVKPEYLFKPWKQQYQKYNQNSNDALMKYHTSLEYKYEVTLDLENFFPTINPIIIYRYIINHLPAYLNDEERKMMKRILQKLLFCKLTTTFDEKTAGQYYKVTKGAGNYDNVDKIEQNEKECWAFKEKSDKFVRGIPQGLPQSYFLGNIYMISIAEIFRKKFTGVSYFYVDDSVIFTNDVREDNFKEQLKELNKQIADEANNFEEDSAIYPEGTEKFYKSDLYGVNVHLDGKSNYTRLDNLDDSEVYLKCISREMSQAGSDFFRMYSDEENRNLEEKLDVLSKQVKAKRDQLVEEKSQKRDSGNEDAIEKDEDDTQKFEKRLTRYYRFFEYRKQRLVAMHQPENGSDEDYKKELEKIIYSELSEEDMEDDEKILQAFMNSYGADIWDAAIGMYQTFADDKEQNVLKNYILKINELCYGKASVEFSYLECTYRDLLRNEEENDYSVEEDIFEETLKRYMTEEDLRDIYNDPYKTLKYLARVRLKRYANKHYEVAEDYSSKLLKKTDEEILKILLSENEKLPSRLRIVCASTQKIIRMVLNTVCSYLFNVEVSNHPVLAQNSKKALTYGELRILSFVRNSLFTIEEFRKREILLDDKQNKDTADYSIMKVLEIYHSFVKDPVSIDKLIITHKYTCDVWKNGSKHLYFYTLHNQEHAIVLIQNIVKLIHAIDFLKISAIDYYILFLACYLHDISMVKIPALDSFLTDTNEADELAQELLDEFNKELQKDNLEEKITENEIKEKQNLYEDELDILSVKKYMLESYKKLDEYFEKKIRGRHAIDSSSEIRQRTEIKYLDMPMRELVAEVSEAHGADERNIYSIKSNASSRLMSIKFDKILLRLADLLDMSSYRVSKPILYHNMEQMSEESAFHWISHLLTQGYKLRTKYEIGSSKSSGAENLKETENIEGVLTPQTITEKLILEIPVDISQMSTIECENPCRKVQIGNISRQEITLICGEGCQNKSNDGLENRCNFLCRWFCVKNDYLIKELVALKEYLNRNKNNYFKCEIEIKIKCNNKTSIEARQFEILNHYIQDRK